MPRSGLSGVMAFDMGTQDAAAVPLHRLKSCQGGGGGLNNFAMRPTCMVPVASSLKRYCFCAWAMGAAAY